MRSFIWYELQQRRGSMLGWGVGIGSFVMLYSLFYPALPGDLTNLDLSEIQLYQAFGQLQMNSFEAYFSSTIMNFLALLLAIFAVMQGTAALVGEEEQGTLELVATLPLPRWQIVLSKGVALLLTALVILLLALMLALIAFVVVAAQIEVTIGAGDIALAMLNAWPITAIFLMISLFWSALLPTRRIAVAAASLVVIASFLGNNLLPMIPELEPLTRIFPFHYYDASPQIFSTGIDGGNTAILLGGSAIFLLASVLSFARRDLTTGAWFWRWA
jgi:ABC-2 type transport system permease protein